MLEALRIRRNLQRREHLRRLCQVHRGGGKIALAMLEAGQVHMSTPDFETGLHGLKGAKGLLETICRVCGGIHRLRDASQRALSPSNPGLIGDLLRHR